MTNDEKELMQDLINQASNKINSLQECIKEKDAEIERLKEENEQSRKLRILGNEVTVEFLDDAVSEPSPDCSDIEKYAKQFRNRIISINEKEIKQAKIDVLNELKKKTHNYYPSIDSYCVSQHVVLVRDIDELIKEAQNET